VWPVALDRSHVLRYRRREMISDDAVPRRAFAQAFAVKGEHCWTVALAEFLRVQPDERANQPV
jgi:hypothetical protein